MIRFFLIIFIFTTKILGNDDLVYHDHFSLFHMGVKFDFIFPKDEAITSSQKKDINKLINEYEYSVSSWKIVSLTSKFNDAKLGDSIKINDDFLELLKKSIYVSQITHGFFDITYPSHDYNLSFKNISFNNHTLTKNHPDIKLNFGGIAKGCVLNLIEKYLHTKNIHNFIINASGDILARGKNGNKDWSIAIQNPSWPGSYIDTVSLKNNSVATSSNNTEPFIQSNNINHIFNPRSNRKNEILSATVIHKDPCISDAIATGIIAMPLLNAKNFILNSRQNDLSILIVTNEGKIFKSSNWEQLQYYPRYKSKISDKNKSSKNKVFKLNVKRNPKIIKQLKDNFILLKKYNFAISKYEVSNQEYQQSMPIMTTHNFCHPDEPKDKDHTPRYWSKYVNEYLNAKTKTLRSFNNETFNKPALPVVGVDWWDAFSYCRVNGLELAHESEWNYAFGGENQSLFPWGNNWKYGYSNTGGEYEGEFDGHIYSWQAKYTKKDISHVGVFNLSGNVREWISDNKIKGGSSRTNPTESSIFYINEEFPGYKSFDLGIRCVQKY